MSAKERKRKSAKERKREQQKGAKERKRALPRKSRKQPGLGTPKIIFSNFFRPDPPPPVRMFLQRKRQIHWYRPFFSPLHGLFRKGGFTGDVAAKVAGTFCNLKSCDIVVT